MGILGGPMLRISSGATMTLHGGATRGQRVKALRSWQTAKDSNRRIGRLGFAANVHGYSADSQFSPWFRGLADGRGPGLD